ncbi:GMC oxidoreductase [Novosphingobium resinovorum]|uniref:2-keto-gluconate dehydrogenase n=1 Tax=Novosphingobium resinovorum TaxID=158500 RepID=A0A031K2M5_9SPHN|nr:GMC family oxidoreductase [Novosphingobium resinovorum]AOR78993.1 2-keto-gluconate dehydrogenase [Novosphingobium resinovorum]EZP82817.1 2-keto-gluconate dehydrogenase subunit [Novosphingobium resinovorum]
MTRLQTQVRAEDIAGHHFDTVVIGSGFGSGFFLHEALRHARTGRVLVLEWGEIRSHADQWEDGRQSRIAPGSTFANTGDHPWNFTIGFGGGTNCWFAQTPRFHPSDFRLHSLYGTARDWPFDYAQLEPFYCEAEEIMAISGDEAMGRVLPRSRPFPQPPHHPSTPDARLKRARPDLHFVMPTARARVATATRPSCCANHRCSLCPVDAKFTANNGLMDTFQHASVTVCPGAEVTHLDASGGVVRSAQFRSGGREFTVHGDLFVLGANAIHSPAILLRSGIEQGPVGKGLHEAYGIEVEAMLDGIDNFDGSTITTGLDYGAYDGPFRKTSGAALLYFENRWKFGFRTEPGRWRQSLPIVIVAEELPDERCAVEIDTDGRAKVVGGEPGAYAVAGAERAFEQLPDILSGIPVERIERRSVRPTESHLQGSLRMGTDPGDSVVDGGQVHHTLRNLVVVGSSVFPTCSASNPSLTVAAMSIRAARQVLA